MVKVMMLGPYESKGRYPGGISTVVNALLEEKAQLRQQGVELIPFDTCRISRKAEGIGRLNLTNLKNFSYLLWDAVKTTIEEKPDVFYLHTSVRLALLKDLLVLRRVKRKTGVRTVLHIHFSEVDKLLTGKPLLDRWMLSAIGKYADEVVLLSQQTLEQLVALGVQREKCHLLYNFASIRYTEQQLRQKQSRQERTLLFLGYISKEKGIYDILTVLRDVREPYRFQVCGSFGSNSEEARFWELAKPLGEKVSYLGFVTGEEKRTVFRDADVLLLPSYGEGVPMTLLEALEAGCGIVTTAVGSIPEVIGQDNGYILSPGDLPALKKAIEAYLTMDASQLETQQWYNHQTAQRYDFANFAEKLVQICKRAVSPE